MPGPLRAMVMCALALGGLQCSPPLPGVPSTPSDDRAFVQEHAQPRPGLDEAVEAPPDTLFPGDVLSVRVLGAPSAQQAAAPLDYPAIIVDRSGRIHLPLVGDVQVAGRTLADAESAVQLELARYDRFSRVALVLMETRGRHVIVSGAVDKPGVVPLVGDARVGDVLAAAGGPKVLHNVVEERLVALGDLAGARLIRGGVALPVDFRLALEAHPRHNVRVQPGDVVIVPPALLQRIVVLGNVKTARTVSFHEGYRLLQALADAGGLTRESDAEDVRIIRGGYERPRVFVANVRDVLAARRPNPVLAPGDIVYVSDHWSAPIGAILDRVLPAMSLLILARTVSSSN